MKALLSSEHFSVDGTLLEAWASPKSFRPTDGSGPPPCCGSQRRAGFLWSEAQQRDPRFDHRSRRPARPQGTGQGGEVVLHRPCADGEPQWADCRRGGDPRIRPCRAAGGGTLDRAARRAASTHHDTSSAAQPDRTRLCRRTIIRGRIRSRSPGPVTSQAAATCRLQPRPHRIWRSTCPTVLSPP